MTIKIVKHCPYNMFCLDSSQQVAERYFQNFVIHIKELLPYHNIEIIEWEEVKEFHPYIYKRVSLNTEEN